MAIALIACSGRSETSQINESNDPLKPIIVKAVVKSGKIDLTVVNDSDATVELIGVHFPVQRIKSDKLSNGAIYDGRKYFSHWSEQRTAKVYLPVKNGREMHEREAVMGERIWLSPGSTLKIANICQLTKDFPFKTAEGLLIKSAAVIMDIEGVGPKREVGSIRDISVNADELPASNP